MTFITNKRTVAVLLVLLVVMFVCFVYLENKEPEDEAQSTLSQQHEVLPEATDVTEGVQINVGESNLVESSQQLDNASGEDFFVEYRLDRDRSRSRQIELLQNIVNNPNSSQTERQEAQKKILNITTILEQELKLENLIKAKGYPEVALFIQPSSVIVIVQANNFVTNDATKICDLISRTTGHTMEQITIIPKA